MTPDELEEMLGAYALDAVDDDERREIEQYLATNPRARAEVDQFQEVAAKLAFSGSAAPEGVWDRIASAIGGGDASAPTVPAVPPPNLVPIGKAQSQARSHRRRRGMWMAAGGGLAAAAVVAIAVLGSMVAHRNHQLDAARAPDVKASAQAALADRDARRATLVSPDGTRSVDVAVQPDGIGYGIVHGLDPLPADRTYQLWGRIDGKVVSLGVLGAAPSTIAFPVAPDVQVLMITEEEAGGVVASQQPPVVQGTVT
jgi:anti-sigma-K factor RskA